jgi:hypothetical protein
MTTLNVQKEGKKWRLTSEFMVQLLAGQSSVASVMMTGLACRVRTVKLTLNQYLGYSESEFI